MSELITCLADFLFPPVQRRHEELHRQYLNLVDRNRWLNNELEDTQERLSLMTRLVHDQSSPRKKSK